MGLCVAVYGHNDNGVRRPHLFIMLQGYCSALPLFPSFFYLYNPTGNFAGPLHLWTPETTPVVTALLWLEKSLVGPCMQVYAAREQISESDSAVCLAHSQTALNDNTGYCIFDLHSYTFIDWASFVWSYWLNDLLWVCLCLAPPPHITPHLHVFLTPLPTYRSN